MAWTENLEANVKTSNRRPRDALFLLVIASILGTVVFYLALGALLLCYYSDGSPLLAVLATSFRFNNNWSYSSSSFYAFSKSKIELFEKPRDVNIVAVVSYRNLERTSILDCYLQRNLVENDGLLDEVVFIPETAEQMHLEWLYETVNKSDSYSIESSWQELSSLNNNDENKNNPLYVKIDGDVVYIEDNVIPTIVNTKLEYPKMTLVSANVIHQPAVAKFHRRPGIVTQQLFDFNSWTATTSYERENQHEQGLPYWKNVRTMKWQEWLRRAGRLAGAFGEKSVYSTNTNTPEAASSESLGASERYSWISQAQQHNSFLHHLERDDLQRYKFPLWKNPPEEISGAFVCATDMTALITKAEEERSNLSTQLLKKHTLIDGKGVVSHYDGMAGVDGLDSTNVLDRYRRYAEENVCPKGAAESSS